MADLSKEFEGSIHLKYRKREIIFVVTVLVLALIWFAVQKYLPTGNAGEVQITVGGEIYETYSLSEEKEIPIRVENGYNIVSISNGVVRVTEADCPDLLCVKMHSISKENQAICCLPHRVVVRIIEGNEGEEDWIDSETY